MRRMAKDVCESVENEPWRWRIATHTFDRDDGIRVWRANIPIFDMNLYSPAEVSFGFAGRLAVWAAFRCWLRQMPLAGYRAPLCSLKRPTKEK